MNKSFRGLLSPMMNLKVELMKAKYPKAYRKRRVLKKWENRFKGSRILKIQYEVNKLYSKIHQETEKMKNERK